MFGSVYVRAHIQRQKRIRSEGGLICSEVSCKILGHTDSLTRPQPFVHWPQGRALINTQHFLSLGPIYTGTLMHPFDFLINV